MKFALLFLCGMGILLSGRAQYVYTINADTVKITNKCDSAELIIRNHTQGVPGFLFNAGNGRTVFQHGLVALGNNTYLIGADTLRLPAGAYLDTIPQLGSDSSVFRGDSQFAGTGATSATDRLTSKLANLINTVEINKGIGGTTLIRYTAGDSSAFDRLPSTEHYRSSLRYMFLMYGQNDISHGDTAGFRTALKSYIDSLTMDKGWPSGKIVLYGVPIRRDGVAAYSGIYSAIIQQTAVQKACIYVNVDSAELANGYNDLFADNIHKNPWGQAIDALAALPYLSDKHGNTGLFSGSLSSTTLTLMGNKNAATPSPSYLTFEDGSGQSAMEFRGSGSLFNHMIGFNAGASVTSGNYNTGVGFQALRYDTSGGKNTFLGAFALGADLTGSYNTALGYGALGAVTTASENTAVGANALVNNTNSNNTAVGYGAAQANVSGGANAAFGTSALAANVGGGGNVALGFDAMDIGVNVSNSVGIGDAALYQSSGGQNVAVGASAMYGNTTGINNTAVGTGALYHDSSGGYNTAIGFSSLYNATNISGNVAIGAAALFSDTSGIDDNAIGNNALNANLSGNENNAHGTNALKSNTTGGYNSAFGTSALYNNLSGSFNIGLGGYSLFSNKSAAYNIGIGYQSLYADTTSSFNVAVGPFTMLRSTASENTAIGAYGLDSNTTGGVNVAIGYQALLGNTTGSQNTAIGSSTGINNHTGSYNTFLGYGIHGTTTGSYNTIIGSQQTFTGADTALSNTVSLSDGAGNLIIYAPSTHNVLIGGTKTDDGQNKLQVTGKAAVSDTLRANGNLVIAKAIGLGDTTIGSTSVSVVPGYKFYNLTATSNITVTLPAIANCSGVNGGVSYTLDFVLKIAQATSSVTVTLVPNGADTGKTIDTTSSFTFTGGGSASALAAKELYVSGGNWWVR